MPFQPFSDYSPYPSQSRLYPLNNSACDQLDLKKRGMCEIYPPDWLESSQLQVLLPSVAQLQRVAV